MASYLKQEASSYLEDDQLSNSRDNHLMHNNGHLATTSSVMDLESSRLPLSHLHQHNESNGSISRLNPRDINHVQPPHLHPQHH